MNIFIGIPGDPPAVSFNGAALPGGPFGWGESDQAHIMGAALAKAILAAHLGSEAEATKFYRRFMWRTIAEWSSDKPFQLTGADIDAVLAEFRSEEKDVAAARAIVGQQRPPVEAEGGIGAGGGLLSPIERKM